MGSFARFGNRLYDGTTSFNFVGRKYLWYGVSLVLVVVAVLSLTVRGLHLSLDFTGGTSYTVTVKGTSTQSLADKVREAVGASGVEAAATPTVTTSGAHDLIIEIKDVTEAQNNTVIDAITRVTKVDSANISQSHVGASWGSEVAHKMITGLVIFLVLVVLFIWAYFREWKMSLAALIALAHDVVITTGVYALSGFEVSPATVTGFLTILGFSLYDTVVVFDKVRENTKNLRARKQTYAQAANLAANQTLVRSINTALIALLPVAAILWVSTVQLGASTLKDLALALFVGMAVGAYSSIFLATPLVAHFKSLEKDIARNDKRVGAKGKPKKPAASADPYAHVPSVHGE